MMDRRAFLGSSAALAGAALVPAQDRVPRIAAINTIYTLRSHAYHIAGRFVHGYMRGGRRHQPPFKLVRMFNDQTPDGDLSRELAAKKGFEISKTVAEALGGDRLDVDGVLLIGEHGDYPSNERGQKLYPRHRLFMEIAAHFRKSGRNCPVFIDKHLSYDYVQAREMIGTAASEGIELMAGSSLPVTWRRPELEPKIGTPMTEAVVAAYGGAEIYGFHALETLQVMMERRAARETGAAAVTALRGPAVWAAGDAGRWSWALLEAALRRSPSRNIGDIRDNVREPVAFLVEYRDGARGAALLLNEHVADFTFAAAVKGRPEPISTHFVLPAPPGAKYFDALCWNIERLFADGRSPYPVERTWLTTTLLDFGMRSLHEGGRRIERDALHIEYAPSPDSGFFRGDYVDDP